MRRLALFLLAPLFLFAAPAKLEQKDIRQVLGRMMKEHTKYKEFTPEVAKRALVCFIDQLDPFKTYLTKSEVGEFLKPTDELVQKVVKEQALDQIAVFESAYQKMLAALERRGIFEKRLTQIKESLEKENPESLDLQELDFAADETALFERLKHVRALQLKTGKRLSGDLAKNFPERLEKNRRYFEDKVRGKDKEEQQQLLFTAVVKAEASALDSQTCYFTPTESRHFIMGMQKKLVGIGVTLRDDLIGLKITEVLKGGPTDRAGALKPDDLIVAVDSEPIAGMHIVDSVELIRGERGTPVVLSVVSDEEMREVKIVRDEIVLHEARINTELHPFGNGNIAHIRLHSFYHDSEGSTGKDVEKAIKNAEKTAPLKGVVLDLRGNPGGLLAEAISTCGLFIDRGIVASLKDATGNVQHLRTLNWEPAYKGPLVILVDGLSASSSEIVAGALQDYGRALIIGENSFGKGTFQLCTIPQNGKVSALGEYKVTCGIYYTVSGKSPQLDGISADISIKGPYSDLKVGERFSKFPLAGGKIEPSFEDTLSDVPIMQRSRIRGLYRLGKQVRTEEITKYLPSLRKNSEKRLLVDKHYQGFLQAMSSKEDSDHVYADTQLIETLAITKDLIYLINTTS